MGPDRAAGTQVAADLRGLLRVLQPGRRDLLSRSIGVRAPDSRSPARRPGPGLARGRRRLGRPPAAESIQRSLSGQYFQSGQPGGRAQRRRRAVSPAADSNHAGPRFHRRPPAPGGPTCRRRAGALPARLAIGRGAALMAVQPQPAIRPLTVLELNTRIHDLLAARLQYVLVKGEVSGVTLRGGHVWFTLKDASAGINAVVFSGTARRMPFLPDNGQELVVTGQVDYHRQYGRINLVVSKLDYDGAGKLRAAIEQLKRKLDAEGAFAAGRKRALPFIPRSIALITSPSGAVIHDLQQTIWERFPNMQLVLYPALVQGMASQRSLVAALRQCDQDQRADVVIVARGGGSFEELMAFNQEAVVRAIQAMRIPVITALGHTSDRTLADLVADREARTPTAAAELVVPKKADLIVQLGERGQRLQRAGLTALIVPAHQVHLRRQTLARLAADLHARRREQLAHLTSMLRQRDPREVWRQRDRSLQECRRRLTRAWEMSAQRMATARLQVGGLRDRLIGLGERGLRDRLRNLDGRGARLSALAPEQTLKRGYSICLDGQDGRIIREAVEARQGQPVKVLLSAGRLEATVDQVVP